MKSTILFTEQAFSIQVSSKMDISMKPFFCDGDTRVGLLCIACMYEYESLGKLGLEYTIFQVAMQRNISLATTAS